MKPKGLARTLHNSTALTAAIIVSFAAPSASAADWIGDTSQSWDDALNWSGDVAPTGNFVINTALVGVYPVLSVDSSFVPVDLFIGTGADQSGRLDQSTDTLALANTGTNGNWMFVGTSGGTGTYNLSGDGSLAVGKLWVGGQVFGENGTGTVTINTTGSVTANSTDDFSGFGQYSSSVLIGWGATGNGTLNLENGTLNSLNRPIYIGSWGSTGLLNQTGGTINAAGIEVGKWFNTSATLNVANGTVNTTYLNGSASGNGGDVLKATINVNSGGTVNSEGDVNVAVGGNGGAGGFGEMNVAAGGTVNVGTTTERWMVVNAFDTVQGRVNVNGGTINLNANSDLRFSTGGGTGASSITLSSGAITSYSGNGTGSSTTGVLDLNRAGGAGANNTFNLDGGTLTIAQVITDSNNGTATFNFNGGTLKAANNSGNFVDLGGAGQSAVVKAGGAKIDSNGFNITIGQALVDGGGNGGLIKSGAGTLTLSAANTYTGTTSVDEGKLLVNGSLDSANATTVSTGATLGGTGSMANSAVTVAGTLSPGASVETFQTGTVNFSDGSTFEYEVDSTVLVATGGDLQLVSGDLNLDSAGANVVNLTLADLATGGPAVPFTENTVLSLINYSGTWNGGLFTLDGEELSDGETFTWGLNTWEIDYNAAEGGENFSGQYLGGSDSFVNLTAVPEPTAALLGGLGMLGLLRRRRLA